jgi:H+/Cl- antiporter ClcA
MTTFLPFNSKDVSQTIENLGLKNFLQYLKSAWGLLSAFTPIFPQVDRFSRLMPPPEPRSGLFSVLATLCGLFAVFYEYTCREKNTTEDRESRAGWFFLLAVVLTIFYAVILYPDLRPVVQIPQQLRHLIQPFVYIFIFYLLTKSFTILAVQEFGKTRG